MRKLALAGLLAGFVTVLLPVAPASAVCYYDLEGMQQCECFEQELARQADALTEEIREEHGVGGLSEQIVCAH